MVHTTKILFQELADMGFILIRFDKFQNTGILGKFMSSYQIVTRQQAAKFLAYVKGEATVQTNHLLFSVESSLSVQKDKILQNDLYGRRNGFDGGSCCKVLF